MASKDDERDDLSPEERERLRREGGRGRLSLDQEIARRYDPAALARMVVKDAGRGEPLEANLRSRMERLHTQLIRSQEPLGAAGIAFGLFCIAINLIR